MKITLEFEIPEEQEEYNNAINGIKYCQVLDSVLRHLRDKLKYCSMSPEETQIYEDLQGIIYAKFDDYGLRRDT